MVFRAVVTSLAVLGLIACSGSSTSAPDVQAFEKASADLRVVVNEHRTLAATVSLPSECTAEHDRYDGKARPLVRQLLDLSGAMDGCLRRMSHDGQADVGATCQSMQDELDRYAGAACAGDSTQNRTEAERDCTVLLDGTDRADQRAGSMQGMMGGGGMMACQP